MSFTKPSNLIATKAFQAIAAASADITFATRQISFAGVGAAMPLDKMLNFKKTAFAAGTLQVNTLDFTAVVATNNTVYTMGIRRFDTSQVITYQIITPSTGTTTASIAQQFKDSITNDLSAVATVSRAGSILTSTEKTVDTGGLGYVVPTGTVDINTVAHVNSSGTLAEVQVYDPLVTAGQYSKYDFAFDKENIASNGAKSLSEVRLIIWANELDADITAFDNRLVGTVSGPLGGILTGAALDVASLAQLQATGEKYAEVI